MRIISTLFISGVSFSLSAQEIGLCKQSAATVRTETLGSSGDSLRSDTIDILKTTINLQITDFANKTISGNSKIDFVSKKNNISTLSLDLLKLVVDSVEINNANLTYSYNDTVLITNLPSVKNIGDTTSITVFYHGTPKIDGSGWGGFYFNGTTEAYNLGVGFAADPHNYGRVWFPCFDNFVERCKFEFNIKTNGGKLAYCNGTLVKDSTDANNFRIRRFVLDEPIPSYLTMVVVGNYAEVNQSFVSTTGNTIPIVLSDLPSDTTKLKNSFINLKNALAGFENRYGPYPWKKVGYAVVPFGSGAMEHATNITYPRPFVQGTTAYETLYAHELAHMWWGDHLTCHRAEEMWINEGMATFSEFIFTEWVYGKTAYKNSVRANHEDLVHYLHLREGGHRAISGVPHSLTYGDHVYKKGADAAHAMRGYLGDSLLFKGLKYVQSSNKFTDITSMKFRDDMTAATGVNMFDFFDDWIFNGGWVQFSVDSFSSVQNGANYNVTVHMRQRLDGAPAYHNNVPLEVTFKDATWKEAVKTISVSGKTTTATVTIPFNPTFAGVDLAEKISDAITSDSRVIKIPGSYFNSTANGRMALTVQAITPGDSAFLLVEHNWAAPDSFKTPNPGYKISPYHYWKVSGVFPNLFDATGTIAYDGRAILSGGGGYLDHQLLTSTNQEDSIVLLYRKNTADDWKYFPYSTKTPGSLTDKYGSIKIDSLLPGEYALAFAYSLGIGIKETEKESESGVTIYPNPFNTSTILQITKSPISSCEVKVYDGYGKLVRKESITGPPFILRRGNLASGMYFYKVSSPEGTLGSGKIIVTE